MALLVGLLGLSGRAAAAADFAGALASYGSGDYSAALSQLGESSSDDAAEELLRGLTLLQLDEPGRTAQAWDRFLSLSQDSSLVDEVSRMRTLVVREADRRAALALLDGGRRPELSADVIAILPFRNVGSEKYEPMGRAIAAVVAANLGAIPNAGVVASGRVEALLRARGKPAGEETKLARELGRMVGAGIVITGAQVDDQGDPPTIEIVSAMIATGTGSRFETGSFLAPRSPMT